jgi:transposase
LEKLLKSGTHQSRKLTRARILLLANDGKTDSEIVEILQTARPTVEQTRKRFVEEDLDCLQEKLRYGARPRLDERVQAHLIPVICSPAPEGYARWTLRLLADKAVDSV